MMKERCSNTTHRFELEKFTSFFKWYVPEVQDLRIEYIGQAIGQKRERGGQDRLSERHDERRRVENRLSMDRDIDAIGIYLSFDAELHGRTGVEVVDMPDPTSLT